MNKFKNKNNHHFILPDTEFGVKREEEIINSIGQGTTGAVKGAALTIAKTVERHFSRNKKQLRIGETTINPTGFVDNVANLAADGEGAREAGERLTRTIGELTLKAHPKKTVNLVVGWKEQREKLKAELEQEPMKIHGFEVKAAKSEAYLGMMFSEEGPKASIDLTIEARRAKAIMKTKLAKQLLRDERIQQLGWLDVARVLYQQTVLPTLTYSAIAWIKMTKKQKAQVEVAQKDCLYDPLELLPSAKYSAVLLEMGMTRIEHIVNQLKINYVSNLLYDKPKSQVVKVLWEQYNSGGGGLIEEVKMACQRYEIPDVMVNYIRLRKEGDQSLWDGGGVDRDH